MLFPINSAAPLQKGLHRLDGKMASPSKDLLEAAAQVLGESEDADILFFNGEISRKIDNKFIRICSQRKRRRANVILVLVTPGGDADAAYRMARCLQSKYARVTIFISGWCKSAGTLLAVGAHRLVMSEFGELGPLDVQVGKRDELFEYGSGLDVDAAIKQLELSAFAMFEDYMLAIERASDGRVTFKTASEISYEMVTRLMGNIYCQIDPMKIGETSRLMTIAKDYSERLAAHSGNLLNEGAIDLLVSSYSSHGFVIDFREASLIFKNVVEANENFQMLQEALGDDALYPVENAPHGEPFLAYLNEENTDAAKIDTDGGAAVAANPASGPADDRADGRGEDVSHSGGSTPSAGAHADQKVTTLPHAGGARA